MRTPTPRPARAAAADASTIDDFLTQVMNKQEARTPEDLMRDLAAGPHGATGTSSPRR